MSKELPIEYCCKCEEPTGCAVKADDSHYNEDGEGPFCWRCWCEDENPRLHEQLEAANHDYEELMKERTDYVAENKTLKAKIAYLRKRYPEIDEMEQALKGK